MKLGRVELQNFQGHEDSKLELSEGVNVITGSSDSGKSSVVRGLRWLLFNKPQGDAYVSHFRKKGEATSVSSGDISRERGATENRYLIGGETYRALRADVPEEVAGYFNIPEDSVQSQSDQYFLLQESAGAVAKKFNQLAGLEQIDDVLKGVSTISRKAKQDIAHTEAALEELEKALRQVAWANAADESVAALEQEEFIVTSVRRSTEALESFIRSIEEADTKIEDFSHIMSAEPECVRLLAIAQEAEELKKSSTLLGDHLHKIEGTESEISKIVIVDPAPIEDWLAKNVELQNKKASFNSLEDLHMCILEAQSNIRLSAMGVLELESKFRDEMGDVCELCESKISMLRGPAPQVYGTEVEEG